MSSGLHHYRTHGIFEGRVLRGRRTSAHGRIMIAGTGRAGTTLLVQLLTRLGFDTGFSRKESRSQVDEISHAGLELELHADSPVVVKSPWLAFQLRDCPTVRNFGVEFMLLPVRCLRHAAESRRRVEKTAVDQGKPAQGHPGGLWLTADPDDQEQILTQQLYNTICLAARSAINPILLDFPRFALDGDYLWQQARDLWDTYGISSHELSAAMSDVVDPNLIHFHEAQ